MRRALYGVPLKKRTAEGRALKLTKKAPKTRRFFVNTIPSRKENHAFPQRNLVCQYFGFRGKSECAAFIFLCASENAAQRENPAARRNAGGGLSFTSRENDLSAQIIFRKLKYFSARLKTALFNKRTQFVAFLRPRRVNAARIIWRAPQKARRRGQSPQPHEKKRRQLGAFL